MSSNWFFKDPDSVTDYTLDWSHWLGTDTITASSWIVPAGITLTSSSFTATTATLFVSGGTLNTDYDLINRITTAMGRQEDAVVTVFIKEQPNELANLLPRLRLHLGDIDSSSYQYLDEWLLLSLQAAIESLQRWWNYKYIINSTTNNVERNSNISFLFPSPPEIEYGDIRPIILMASIIVKEGTLQNSAWNVGSWKDAEISYSNIESSRLRQDSLKNDWTELTSILKVPQKKLINTYKSSLPGYKDNPFETMK